MYRIHVEFRLAEGVTLRSNVFEALVHDRDGSDEIKNMFQNRYASCVLRFGQDVHGDKGIDILRAYLAVDDGDAARRSYAQLAVGSALLQGRAGGRSRVFKKEKALGIDLLNRALPETPLISTMHGSCTRGHFGGFKGRRRSSI